jgi:hypothetical protein
MAKQEVAKQQEQSKALAKMFDDAPVTGFEGADFSSYATPFLRILQQNSPQLLEDAENHIEGAKAGLFFNTVTNEVYGKSIKVIPIKFERLFIEWRPNRGGFAGMHDVDHAMRISEVNPKNNLQRINVETGNDLQDTHTFYLLIVGEEEKGPIVFPLTSTGMKHSRKWLSMAKLLRLPSGNPAPLFSSTYELTTLVNENEQGRWYQIGDKSKTGVERVDWITTEQYERVKEALDMFDSIKERLQKEAEGEQFESNTPY